MNQKRCHRLILDAIRQLELDLSGLTVLTEAATGPYSLTASIAALAKAKKVCVLSGDSRYGTAKEAVQQTMDTAKVWGVADKIQLLTSREDKQLQDVDIVTNLGFVRPINQALLGRLNPGVSIALMWEPWEFRESDLDLAACRDKQIPVLGTNESHPDLQIFEYVGYVAMKLLFELDIEVFRSHIVVLGHGIMADKTHTVLNRAGAQVELISGQAADLLSSKKAQDLLRKADAVVVVEHHQKETLIGKNGQITVRQLKDLNPGLAIAHICGAVDQADLETAQIAFAPRRLAPAGFMSALTDYVGPKPMIDLHTAGLKVGERLARQRQAGLAGTAAEEKVLSQTDLAMGFKSPAGVKR